VSVEDVLYGRTMEYALRTLRATGAMPASLEITHTSNIRLEPGPTSLLVLADTSGSMADGTRLANLRSGLRHLCGLTRGVEDLDLTIISFADDARIVFGPLAPPSDEKIARLCADLQPEGNTNTGAALRLALTVAEERQAKQRNVHAVLFTDGYDNHGLLKEFTAYKQAPGSVLHELWTKKFLTLHCVGICADADARMLSDLGDIAYAGTFQVIKDADIAGLMGALWALMLEMVGVNGVARIAVDGAQVASHTFPLRVCHPPIPLRVSFDVPEGAQELSAEITVLDEVRTVRLALPRADADHVDPQCALDAVAAIQSEAATTVAGLVRARTFALALAVVDRAVERIQALRIDHPAVANALAVLATEAAALHTARSDAAAAREVELRALSRAVTERSTSMSIDPSSDSTTMSQMQREMSSAF
jgi:hypothetical protein